jgi:hypothetical protein
MRKVMLTILAMSMGTPANAQFVGNWNFGSGWVDSENINRMNRVLDEQAKPKSSAPYERQNAVPANPALLRFTPDLALRKLVASQFASALGGGNAETPSGRFVASGAALSDAHQRMTALGLAPNNMGDAMAFFLASHWSFTRGGAAPPNRPTMQALKAQMAAMLGSQPSVTQMPNSAKQQQADSMLILTAVSTQEMAKAQGNPAGTEAIAASASQLLKGMGFDPAIFELTPQGMVPAR